MEDEEGIPDKKRYPAKLLSGHETLVIVSLLVEPLLAGERAEPTVGLPTESHFCLSFNLDIDGLRAKYVIRFGREG